MTGDSPREVLEAVRRLEAELEVLRRQARDRQRDAIDLREAWPPTRPASGGRWWRTWSGWST